MRSSPLSTSLSYRHHQLCIDAIPIQKIIESVPTPFYLYSEKFLQTQAETLRSLFPLSTLICVAIKANSNLRILEIFQKYGFGADVVSIGEMKRALQAGIPAEKIVFSGIGKTQQELQYAIDHNIKSINIESFSEFERLHALATNSHQKIKVMLRLNPDITPVTHSGVTTGSKDNKFGMPLQQIEAIIQHNTRLEIQGLAVHIGSQILDIRSFHETFQLLQQVIDNLNKQYRHPMMVVDCGGGIGIPYTYKDKPINLQEYAQLLYDLFPNFEIILEPGRFLTGNGGFLVTKVEYIKKTHKNFLVLDAGMHNLVRPAMYNSYHHLLPIQQASEEDRMTPFDIVGPICETTDTFLKNHPLHSGVQEGDAFVFETCGAYGSVMHSMYNSRPIIPEILVKTTGEVHLIRRCVEEEEMMTWDTDLSLIKNAYI